MTAARISRASGHSHTGGGAGKGDGGGWAGNWLGARPLPRTGAGKRAGKGTDGPRLELAGVGSGNPLAIQPRWGGDKS